MNLYSKQKQISRHRKQTYGYQKGKVGRDKLGALNQHIYTTIYKIAKQGPTAQHRELYLVFCNNLQGKVSEKIDTYVCITEPLCCTPETNTTL